MSSVIEELPRALRLEPRELLRPELPEPERLLALRELPPPPLALRELPRLELALRLREPPRELLDWDDLGMVVSC